MRTVAPWRRFAAGLVLAACAASTGCISTPPPSYQPGIDNTERLLAGRNRMNVGAFDAAPDVDNRALGMRGSSLQGGEDGRFSTYLQSALIAELREAGRFDAASQTIVTGRLTGNKLSAVSSRYGSAVVAAEFVVTRNGERVYAKTLQAEHHWDSSFMGAIAIPAAVEGYAATVQKLLGALFADPEFRAATDAGARPDASARRVRGGPTFSGACGPLAWAAGFPHTARQRHWRALPPKFGLRSLPAAGLCKDAHTMRTEGTLKSWNDDRGFGFIATAGGDIFLHISALPPTGRRPQIGERLSFTIEAGADGKKRAVGAIYLDAPVGAAAEIPARAPRPARPAPEPRRQHADNERRHRRHRERHTGGGFGRLLPVLGFCLLFYGGFWLFNAFESSTLTAPGPAPAALAPSTAAPTAAAARFSCDGRTHCSQMSSCAEARYFLRQCPGVEMDGDGDGNPCEEQHCGH